MLARRGGDAATLANLTSRIDSWWAMIAILAVTFLAGKIATILLFALVSFWCLREFISLTPTRPSDHYTLAAAFYLFLPAQYVLLWDGWLSVFTIAIPVYAYLLLPVISVLRGETEDFLLRISKIQWALMLAVYCLSHAPALLMLRIEDYPVGPFGLLAFLLLIVQASDVLQYVFGKLFGKRRLAPLGQPQQDLGGPDPRRGRRHPARRRAARPHALRLHRRAGDGGGHHARGRARRPRAFGRQTLARRQRTGAR